MASGQDPLPPIGVESRIVGHRRQAGVVAQAVARDRLELIDEQSLRRGSFGPIVGFASQDFQGQEQVELPLFLFRLGHHEALKRGEIVGQLGHRRAEHSQQLQLAGHEIDGHRQLGRGQDFLAHTGKQVLRRQSLIDASLEGAEEVGLLDVFFAVQHLSIALRLLRGRMQMLVEKLDCRGERVRIRERLDVAGRRNGIKRG